MLGRGRRGAVCGDGKDEGRRDGWGGRRAGEHDDDSIQKEQQTGVGHRVQILHPPNSPSEYCRILYHCTVQSEGPPGLPF